VLWVDPGEGRAPVARRPLDLGDLLPHLDPEGDWNLDSTGQADRVKVLVADPFKLFRQALVCCFEEREDMQVVRVVDSPDAYRRAVETARFDVAVVASDFLEGTRAARDLRPGESLLTDQGAAAGQPGGVPLVVLVSDEDLEDGDPGADGPVPHLWEPGRPVEGKRVAIPRGAPVEVLVQAINIVSEKRPGAGAKPSRVNVPYSAEQQAQAWS
jgi:hypothetical protein